MLPVTLETIQKLMKLSQNEKLPLNLPVIAISREQKIETLKVDEFEKIISISF